MIPTENQAKHLWDTYKLPGNKRIHAALVAKVAMFFAKKIPVNNKLLLAATLLHDIDKAVTPRAGERHPDTAVRILREENMGEVADVVARHPLHAILDPTLAPVTPEQKLLYLSDKMVKYDIVGVDRRFALWREEHLPVSAQQILNAAYPKVKKLEQEVFTLAGISLDDVVKLA